MKPVKVILNSSTPTRTWQAARRCKIATQKQVEEYVKEWETAADMETAVKAADGAAREYDALYEDSAKNLLARKPALLMLLAAFVAGRRYGAAEEAEKHKPVQGMLDG